MLIKLHDLVIKYKLKIKGVLHIGAHKCEELVAYKKEGMDDHHIIWVEGNPDLVKWLNRMFRKRRVYHYLISDKDNQEVTFNIASNGESSSILEFGSHTKHHPHIRFTKKMKLKTKTIKTMYKEKKIPDDFANFLNIDIQGVELQALKGMGDLLNNFDYLYLEVNEEQLYKDCALVGEIDEYVEKFGFKRVQTHMTQFKWGDGFYIKEKK